MNSLRTRPHEFRGMGNNVIGRIAGDHIPADCQGAEAAIAAARRVGILIFIRRQVPFDHIPGPISGSADHQFPNMPLKVFGEISRGADPLLGEVKVFIRMSSMDGT